MAVAPARGPSAGVVVSLLPAFCCAGDDRSGTNETGVMRTIILNVPTSNTSNGIGLLEHFGSMGLGCFVFAVHVCAPLCSCLLRALCNSCSPFEKFLKTLF